MYYIKQTSKYSCGFACLKMVLANLRNSKDFLFIPDREENKARSFDSLIKEGKKYGLVLQGIKIEQFECFENEVKFPLIISINPNDNYSHSVVILKFKHNKAIILDPDQGKYTINKDKLLEIWDGKALMVENDDGSECYMKMVSPMSKGNYAFSLIMQILSFSFGILGIYFLNKEQPVYYPIIFFVLFAVIEIIRRFLVEKFIDKTNNIFLSNYIIFKKDYMNFFENLELYKRNLLINPYNLVVLLLGLAFVIFITLINDISNLLLIILPLFLAVIERLIYTNISTNKIRSLANQENDLVNAKSHEEYKDKISSIHNEASKISKFATLRRFIYLILMVAFAVSSVFILKTVTLPYLVFYFFIEYFIFDTTTKLLDSERKQDELNVSKAKIYNLLHTLEEKD